MSPPVLARAQDKGRLHDRYKTFTTVSGSGYLCGEPRDGALRSQSDAVLWFYRFLVRRHFAPRHIAPKDKMSQDKMTQIFVGGGHIP